jgi:glycolate oxidase
MSLDRLAAALPGRVLRDPELLEPFASDESIVEPVVPAAVVQAASEADVAETLRWATKHGVPVTPRGGGSGKAGGCIAAPGGVVLDLRGLNRIGAIRPQDGWAEAEAGVVTLDFKEAAAAERRWYAPDPGALGWSTLGGNVATNAGGPVALRYGVTGDHVLGVRAVLADGRIVDVGRRQPKGVAGYDLRGLLVGSEGTLGIITQLRLKLLPRPRAVAAAAMAFDSVDDAAAAVVAGASSGLRPRALELFDGVALARLRRDPEYPVRRGSALLLVEFDGEPGHPERDLQAFAEGLDAPPASVEVQTGAGRDALWALRRETSRRVKVGAVGWVTEDVAVPLGAVPAMLRTVAALGERHDLVAFAYGHAGDGNLHVNVLWEDPAGAERAPAAVEAVIDAALACGGTITGEHGVGLAKRPFLRRELGDAQVALMRAVKQAWDPAGILNPGKVLPPE